jgi:CheY-like chemotaxis protein
MSTTPDPIPSSRCILYAEDEVDDVFFFKNAMKVAESPCMLQAVADGEQAMDYLSGNGAFADRSRFPFPALVLLDINMPRKNGREVLKWIRQQPQFKSLPVVMLTSSSRTEDLQAARELGAEDYLLKPSDPKQLVELVKKLHTRWLA